MAEKTQAELATPHEPEFREWLRKQDVFRAYTPGFARALQRAYEAGWDAGWRKRDDEIWDEDD